MAKTKKSPGLTERSLRDLFRELWHIVADIETIRNRHDDEKEGLESFLRYGEFIYEQQFDRPAREFLKAHTSHAKLSEIALSLIAAGYPTQKAFYESRGLPISNSEWCAYKRGDRTKCGVEKFELLDKSLKKIMAQKH